MKSITFWYGERYIDIEREKCFTILNSIHQYSGELGGEVPHMGKQVGDRKMVSGSYYCHASLLNIL